MDEPVIGVDFKPGCPNPQCSCRHPGRPCDEFMGITEGHEFSPYRTWCPRCGWHLKHHASVAEDTP
jgi:hypothetical protein